MLTITAPPDGASAFKAVIAETPPAPPFTPRNLRHQVRRLRDFEHWGGAWRGALALVRLAADQALPLAAAVVVAVVTVCGRVAEAALSATLALVLSWLTKSTRARFPWHTPVSSRLRSWEEPNPPTHLEVLLRESDIAHAKRALRRAGFNPRAYATHLGTSVPDAPDLDFRVGVQEPEAHPQSSSDDDRVRRVARALESAGIRARVGSLDVFPGGDAMDERGRRTDDGHNAPRTTASASKDAPPLQRILNAPGRIRGFWHSVP